MVGGAVAQLARPLCQSPATPTATVTACSFAGGIPIPKFTYPLKSSIHPFSDFSAPQLALSLSLQKGYKVQTHFSHINSQIAAAASSTSVGSAEYAKEHTTNVKFQRALDIPGCSASLSLLGTGYREKVFTIIGVKVYAAGLYVNPTILTSELNSWKGRSADEIEGDLSLFNSIYQSPLEKSLQITLVRDVDGKTFWDALDEAVFPRINAAPSSSTNESALSTFRSVFQGRSLKKGTLIFLTWLEPSKMLVSVSSDGVPTGVEATIESEDVTKALFDVFWGESPVSPSLKTSVAAGLAAIL